MTHSSYPMYSTDEDTFDRLCGFTESVLCEADMTTNVRFDPVLLAREEGLVMKASDSVVTREQNSIVEEKQSEEDTPAVPTSDSTRVNESDDSRPRGRLSADKLLLDSTGSSHHPTLSVMSSTLESGNLSVGDRGPRRKRSASKNASKNAPIPDKAAGKNQGSYRTSRGRPLSEQWQSSASPCEERPGAHSIVVASPTGQTDDDWSASLPVLAAEIAIDPETAVAEALRMEEGKREQIIAAAVQKERESIHASIVQAAVITEPKTHVSHKRPWWILLLAVALAAVVVGIVGPLVSN